MLKLSYFNTKLGKMLIVASDVKLYLLEFADCCNIDSEISSLENHVSKDIIPGDTDITAKTISAVENYYSNKLKVFDTSICYFWGTAFQLATWHAILAVQFGCTKSYLHIAQTINHPRAYRACANAVGNNRFAIMVPCHRIIGSNGQIGGYKGGVMLKKQLLDFEIGSIRRS